MSSAGRSSAPLRSSSRCRTTSRSRSTAPTCSWPCSRFAAGLIGVAFKTFLYWLEGFVDELWKGRPEWARPAVGGVALGLVLLALPQMYGVGYPVMGKALAGQYALWFIVILMLGKVLASSLTLSIGGSGGVFAPSLFIGAMLGMAFGTVAHNLSGPRSARRRSTQSWRWAGSIHGGRASAADSDRERRRDDRRLRAHPRMMLARVRGRGLKQLSYGNIYTTKLLRRGIDIERPKTTSVLQRLTVADVMQPIPHPEGHPPLLRSREPPAERDAIRDELWARVAGPVTDTRQPQELFGEETLEQALRQLTVYDHDGLPVVSHDRQHLTGWITRADVLQTLANSASSSAAEIEHGAIAAGFAAQDPKALAHTPSTPLSGYEIIEITITPQSPALGRQAGNIAWPPGSLIVAIGEGHEITPVRNDTELHAGERIILLAPAASPSIQAEPLRRSRLEKNSAPSGRASGASECPGLPRRRTSDLSRGGRTIGRWARPGLKRTPRPARTPP